MTLSVQSLSFSLLSPLSLLSLLLSPSSEKNQNDDVRSLKYLQDAMRVMSHRPCERHRNAEKRQDENLKNIGRNIAISGIESNILKYRIK